MATRQTRTLSFTPEQAAFLDACVTSGHFQSASEVVRTALRMLEEVEARRAADLARARGMVAEGLEDLDRGRSVDGDDYFAAWATKLRRLKHEGPST